MRASILLLASLAALLGCDTTGPPITGAVLIAHAAPDAGPFRVVLDGDVLAPSLELGQAVGDSVAEGDHLVALSAGAEPTGVPIDMSGGAMGVVIMGGDEPGPRLYPHTHIGTGGGRFKVINAVPDRRLDVALSGDAASLSARLDFTSSVDATFRPDTFEVMVAGDGLEEPVVLGSVTVPNGRTFVVIHPAGDGSGSLRLLVF